MSQKVGCRPEKERKIQQNCKKLSKQKVEKSLNISKRLLRLKCQYEKKSIKIATVE